MTDKKVMEQAINDCPTHLYTYSPEPGDTRYVFSDIPWSLHLGSAYLHAIRLEKEKSCPRPPSA